MLMNNQKKCVICLDNFKTKKKINCGHEFCSKCIAINLIYSNKCPLCRKKIKKKNKFNIINSTSLTRKINKTKNNDLEIHNIFKFFYKMIDKLCNLTKRKRRKRKKIIINKIYLLAFNNLWYLEQHVEFKNKILNELNELDILGWKKAKFWINRFNKIYLFK